MTKVGFIGLGTQGKYLAVNLATAGYDLMVFDVRAEPLEELRKAGAKIATCNRDVGKHAEIIEICVLNDEQTEAVVLAADGVLAGAAPGSLIVIHGTVSPKLITRLAAATAAKGVELIDVPVSGSEGGAKSKTMSYMAGGTAAQIERCRPLFETSGQKITHCGPLGTGIRAKIAHQIIISINMLAAYEGMRVGREAGVSAEVLEKVMTEGHAQSKMADNWFRLKLRPHATGVFFKDLDVSLKFAHELGIALPGAALTQQLLDTVVP